MDVATAFLMFGSGILSYAVALRIFKIYTKSLFYKMTFINCLCILKFADGLAQDLINSCENADEESTSKAFKHWRLLALYSLKACVPDNVWRELSITEWNMAMRLLDELNKERSENEKF